MSGILKNKGGVGAVLVVACMLLCVLSPAVVSWNEDYVFAEDSKPQEPNFFYYALGDSMVNGFGMPDYYPNYENEVYVGGDSENHYGFLMTPEKAFPTLLKGEIEKDPSIKVNDDYMLAISGLRSAELRALLYDDFYDDTYDLFNSESGRYKDALKFMYEKAGCKDLSDMKEYYRGKIANADLITYNFHYDFGYNLGNSIGYFAMGMPEPGTPFELYIDDCSLDAIGSFIDVLKSKIIEYIVAQGMNIDDLAMPIALAELLSRNLAFTAVSYCSNFDANMAYILENNKNGYNANIIVIDSYNSYEGINAIIAGIPIPLGEIYGYVLDAVNMYTTYLSPYAPFTTHAFIDETPTFYATEFAEYEEGDEITPAAKMAAMYCTLMYNGLPTAVNDYELLEHIYNDDVAKFLKHFYSGSNIDVAFMMGEYPMMDKATAALFSVFSLSNAYDMMQFNEYFGDSTFEFDESDSSIMVTGVVGFDTTDPNNPIPIPGKMEFTNEEYGILKMPLQLFFGEAMMAHPSEIGHGEILESVMEAYNSLDENNCELLDLYALFLTSGLPAIQAYIEGLIAENMDSIESVIAELEYYIGVLMQDVSQEVAEVKEVVGLLQQAIDILKGNIVEAIDLFESGVPASVAFGDLGLRELQSKGIEYLTDLTDAGYDSARYALMILSSEEVNLILDAYDEAIISLSMIEMTIEMVVSDLPYYVDDEEYYYECDNYLYISDRGLVIPDYDPTGDFIEFLVGHLGAVAGNLRLMDYVALLTGNQFDGKVAYDDAIVEYFEAVELALPTSNVVIVEANAGNLMFLLNEILTYEDAESLDFGIYSGLIGEDATAFLNDIENKLAPYMAIIEENFPDYVMPAEMLTFLAERLAYMALGTMEGLLHMPGVVNLYNELATLMFVGMHNPLENVFIVDGEDVIPVGEIFDAYVTVFNTFVYELCEEVPGVIYVDATEMYDVDEPIIINTSMLDDPKQMGAILELVNNFSVDMEYVIEQADAYLENLECIPTYDVTWTNYDGTILDYEWNVADYRADAYDGDVPARASDADYDYVFTGEWACEIYDRDVTYIAIFDEIYNKVDINGEVGSSDVEFDVTEVGDKDFAKVSVDDFTVILPAGLFAGVETVKVSMKVVEHNDIPGNLIAFTEGKKVISLELFLDGTKTSDFGDNEVTVSVDYALAEGEDASTLAVWYMNEDTMTLEKVKSEYVDGKLVITMDHFSYWVIGHEAVDDDSEDKAFPAMVAVLLVIVVGLCVALLRLKK